MDVLKDSLNKKLETTRKEKRQTRKESRAKIVNSKRNLIFTESTKDVPPPNDAERLKLWRIEKKKKMEQEKLKRKPPFLTYINVKHTGLSPFRKNTITLAPTKNRSNKIVSDGLLAAVSTVSFQKETKVQRPLAPIKNVKQTKKVPLKTDSNVVKPDSKRITRQRINGINSEQVNEVGKKIFRTTDPKNKSGRTTSSAITKLPEIEKKAFGAVQPTNKPSRANTFTMKTENDVKVLKKSVINKKVPERIKSKLIEDKENVPIRVTKTLPNNNNNCNNCGKEKHHFTRSRKNPENAKPMVAINATNGPDFQRLRLEEETKKLQELRDNWLTDDKKNVPKEIRDEILSVTGLTTLLISSKFEQFKSLINDCDVQLAIRANGQQQITPDDLDGFWEMMFLQVVQLQNKYMRLEKLMLNNWIDPDEIPRNKAKKTMIKKSKPKKSGQSRFKEFLAKQKQYNEKNLGRSSPLSEDLVTTLQHNGDEVVNLDLLKNCRATPKAVKNLIKARKSRRSSMNVMMSMSGIGKFDVSGTALLSPKPEKQVSFVDVSF